MVEDRKSVYSIASEFCREAAVLIFVFGNLDMWFRSFTGELSKLALGWRAIVSHVTAIFALTVFFGLTGIFARKVEGQMSQSQELILAMYAGFGGIVLLTGYVYKEIRDRKRQRKQPQ